MQPVGSIGPRGGALITIGARPLSVDRGHYRICRLDTSQASANSMRFSREAPLPPCWPACAPRGGLVGSASRSWRRGAHPGPSRGTFVQLGGASAEARGLTSRRHGPPCQRSRSSDQPCPRGRENRWVVLTVEKGHYNRPSVSLTCADSPGPFERDLASIEGAIDAGLPRAWRWTAPRAPVVMTASAREQQASQIPRID